MDGRGGALPLPKTAKAAPRQTLNGSAALIVGQCAHLYRGIMLHVFHLKQLSESSFSTSFLISIFPPPQIIAE